MENYVFLAGAATAAHQVEGNNRNSDFWIMENVPGSMYKEPSGDAVDHYHRYREDIGYLKQQGLNAYRFSIEWARIEPQKGVYDQKEIEHYREVLTYCHQSGIMPVVTLMHFSSPSWLISEGGWKSETTTDAFARYAELIAKELGGLTPYICTINEANMGLQLQKITQQYINAANRDAEQGHPQDGDVQVGMNMDAYENMDRHMEVLADKFKVSADGIHTFLSGRTEEEELLIMRAHQKAREAIRAVNASIKIGATFSIYDYQAAEDGEEMREQLRYEDFGLYLPYLADDDFIGVQNYTRKMVGPDGIIEPPEGSRMTKAGYEFYPESIGNVVRYVASKWEKEIIFTENGISIDDDRDRVEFIMKSAAVILYRKNGGRSCGRL